VENGMDENEGYHRVAALTDLPEGGTLAVEVDGRPVVLVRDGDAVHAMDDACPHAGAPLSEGVVDEGALTCTWHGWGFRLKDGVCLDQPGVVAICHRVKVVDGDVLVRL
jgi:nitrite reductase/ring-hydroxylating ferredoxin subunit